MSAASERAAAVRRGAGLFTLEGRGVLAVEGEDRVRWLDGMLSNDVTALAPGPKRSGCYATLLTRQGRIVADLHVLLRPGAFWLETEGDAVARVVEHLDRFIIADDVRLTDLSATLARFALEGPRAPELLARAAEGLPALAPEAGADTRLGGVSVLVAAWGWSGAPAFQLFAPAPDAESVAGALRAAGEGLGLVEGDAEVLEILRIEAGVPRLGRELGEDVLPAEARLLERAVSFAKGCYTGQEVVARLASQGRPSHRLVGFRLPRGELPAVGTAVLASGRRVGEVTSACVSPRDGAIALGYVRVPHDAPGTRVEVQGREARVADLPFGTVAP